MPTNPITAPRVAEVRQDTESEAALIREAKESISNNNWKLGDIASRWTACWARGRTDADFGAMVGMTEDQVYQRRRVWDRFGGKTDTYRNLSWSHFYAALAWDDAESYLQWASDNQATVAEMKARNRYVSESHQTGSLGNSENDDEDPFGEGAEGAGTEAGSETGGAGGEEGGTETDGDEPQGEATRPPRKGKDKPGVSEPDFATLKAKTVKTAEALMRAMGDLNDVHRIPQYDAMKTSVGKMIQTVKAVNHK